MFVARDLRALELNNAAADGNSDRLGAIVRAKFFHDVFNVNLHRTFGDKEAVGDVAIAVALCNLLQNFDFASGERFVAQMVRKARCNLAGMAFLPAYTLRIASSTSLGGMLFSI